MSLEQGDRGLSIRERGNDDSGRRISMFRSKYESRDEKSTDGKEVLPLRDMTVSYMGMSYPNYHVENYEVDGHVTGPDDGLDLTDHASIPTGSMPYKIPPWDHSDGFDDEGLIIDPKSDTEGKEPMVDRNKYSVHDSPECYDGSAQLVQLKQPSCHREEVGTGGGGYLCQRPNLRSC